jgi:hypothetical protein
MQVITFDPNKCQIAHFQKGEFNTCKLNTCKLLLTKGDDKLAPVDDFYKFKQLSKASGRK